MTSRLQLALNVSDLDAAVQRYAAVFAVEPAKRRPGYASFTVGDPPLTLVLFENPHALSALNHLGVRLDSLEEVRAAAERFTLAGLTHTVPESDVCCHALQTKVWVDVPDVPLGAWEFYTVVDDDPGPGDDECAQTCCATSSAAQGSCCAAGAGDR